jgi:hypothetical protein
VSEWTKAVDAKTRNLPDLFQPDYRVWSDVVSFEFLIAAKPEKFSVKVAEEGKPETTVTTECISLPAWTSSAFTASSSTSLTHPSPDRADPKSSFFCFISGLRKNVNYLYTVVAGDLTFDTRPFSLGEKDGKCLSFSDGLWFRGSPLMTKGSFDDQALPEKLLSTAKSSAFWDITEKIVDWTKEHVSGMKVKFNGASVAFAADLVSPLSHSCAGCFEVAKVCMRQNCMLKCVSPRSDSCYNCNNLNCQSAFESCTGLDKHSLPPRLKPAKSWFAR